LKVHGVRALCLMIAFIFKPSSKTKKSRLWSTRIRLNEWPKAKTFGLHVTDKRVANKKMWELVTELEREAHGVGVPRPAREAWKIPLSDHHAAFVRACEVSRLSRNTINKYQHALPKLFARCRWLTLRDVTAQSFVHWREQCGLAPKTVNDLLGCARTFMIWMKREHLILRDPLEDVRKIPNPGAGSFRRSLSLKEIPRLLQVSPPYRSLVYLTIIYTGLRRTELNGLKWADFDFTMNPPQLKLPASITKNRREATIYLRPELAVAIQAARPQAAKPDAFVFQGQLPRVQTMQKDLEAAGIPFEDARKRRIDLHALRKTYGTLLAISGVSPRVAMELMRHSDMKLTMGVYTDVTQLPIIAESARLPSFPFAAKEGRRVGNQNLRTGTPFVKSIQFSPQTEVTGNGGLQQVVSDCVYAECGSR
jgi:integrase